MNLSQSLNVLGSLYTLKGMLLQREECTALVCQDIATIEGYICQLQYREKSCYTICRNAYQTQGKLEAVRIYKYATGKTLMECKTRIEELAAQYDWKLPEKE